VGKEVYGFFFNQAAPVAEDRERAMGVPESGDHVTSMV
jgi:hypothetical protein